VLATAPPRALKKLPALPPLVDACAAFCRSDAAAVGGTAVASTVRAVLPFLCENGPDLPLSHDMLFPRATHRTKELPVPLISFAISAHMSAVDQPAAAASNEA
jgi:hypothetical protein